MLAIDLDGGGDPEDTTGPTDDAYVFISTTMLPQDPYCCAGPDEDDEGRQCNGLQSKQINNQSNTPFGVCHGVCQQAHRPCQPL